MLALLLLLPAPTAAPKFTPDSAAAVALTGPLVAPTEFQPERRALELELPGALAAPARPLALPGKAARPPTGCCCCCCCCWAVP